MTPLELSQSIGEGVERFRKATGNFPGALLLGEHALATLRGMEALNDATIQLHRLPVYTCADVPPDTVLPLRVDKPILARFYPR